MRSSKSITMLLSIFTLTAASFTSIARDIALSRNIDEFKLDRSAIAKSPTRSSLNDQFEWKSGFGLYLGVEDSPNIDNSANNTDLSTTSLSSQQLSDTYIGLRQSFSDFSYNIGLKSYNNNFDTNASTSLDKMTINEYFVGGRVKNFGFGIAQSEKLQQTRASYFYQLMDTAFQFDVGQTIAKDGDNFYAWQLNASKRLNEINVNVSMKKSFTDAISQPAEMRIELSKTLDVK